MSNQIHVAVRYPKWSKEGLIPIDKTQEFFGLLNLLGVDYNCDQEGPYFEVDKTSFDIGRLLLDNPTDEIKRAVEKLGLTMEQCIKEMETLYELSDPEEDYMMFFWY